MTATQVNGYLARPVGAEIVPFLQRHLQEA
jgi:hypothetical protein